MHAHLGVKHVPPVFAKFVIPWPKSFIGNQLVIRKITTDTKIIYNLVYACAPQSQACLPSFCKVYDTLALIIYWESICDSRNHETLLIR